MGYYIKVEDDVNIYVEDLNPTGNKTILWIHGWPANYKMFEYQFNELPCLGYRCIGVDLRGYGQSSKPWCGYDYNRLADDIRCVIETLDLQDITLGGHSTGGAVAIRYMARHKGARVGKLALFAAAAPSLVERPDFPQGVAKATIDSIIAQTYQDRPQMLRNFGDIFFFQSVTAAFSDWFFQLGLQAASWSTIAVANAWLTETLFADLAQIDAPTLILHGIHDQVVPFELGVAQREAIRQSQLVPFKFSGHGLFYDEREKFNQELTNFIER